MQRKFILIALIYIKNITADQSRDASADLWRATVTKRKWNAVV